MEEELAKKELEKILKNFSIEGTELEKIYLKFYLKVLEKFPEIKKEEIKIKYFSFVDYAYTLMIDPFKLVYNDIVVDPTIILGHKFFELDEQEKEAILAHELGHYSRYKNYSTHKIVQGAKRNKERNAYTSNPIAQVMMLFDEKTKHRAERIQKWYVLHELYADKRAAEAGYRDQLVASLKKFYAENHDELQQFHKEELELRIKNLEEKLKEEGA